MTKITKVSEHIEQACRVYGEEWRDILFKKWTYLPNIDPDDSHVFFVIRVSPNINKTHLYDTEKEATEALMEYQNKRLRKVMTRTNWTRLQSSTNWVRGLENDLEVVE